MDVFEYYYTTYLTKKNIKISLFVTFAATLRVGPLEKHWSMTSIHSRSALYIIVDQNLALGHDLA